MKLSNRTLLNGVTILNKLNHSELPIKVAFIVLKNTKEVEKELANYYELREKLVKKYAVLDDEGNPVPDEYGNLKFEDDNIQKWNSDINELLDSEVNIKLQTLSIHGLFKSELCVTPSELAMIEFMLKE